MTRLALIRHGETDWNRNRRIQGSSDIPLNDTGREQAAVTGRVLAARGEHWDGAYASYLGRAIETAQIVSSALGLGEVQVVQNIEERHYGQAEGLTGEELFARFPDDVVPGRETREEVIERVLPALLALGAEHEDESLIVVSHGGVINALLRLVTDDTVPAPGDYVINGSVHEFTVTGGELRLDAYNSDAEQRDFYQAATQ